jgi:hypothetical protein
MAKRKTARPAGRARGRGAAAGRPAAAGGRKRGTTSASSRGAKARAKTAGRSRKTAAAARPASGGTRKTRKRAAATRKPAPGGRTSRAVRARPAPAGAKRRSPASAKALRRRQSGATGGSKKKRAAASTRKAATSRAGRSTSTPPRGSLGKRGRHSRLAEIERDRRLIEETVETPPSSLDLSRKASAARSGRAELDEALAEHTETGPALTGGDIDADWQSAYGTGDEAPGGDMPTPDKSVVEDIGKALGLEYQDNEELKGVDKVEERDRHRWEYDPASSEDYQERSRRK